MTTLQTQAINTALIGNWEEAVRINKSLIKEDPADVDAMNRLAFAFSILGKVKDAKLTYQKVLKIDPLNSIAQRNIKRIPNGSVNKEANGKGYKLSNIFLEEPGKTKIIELINIAQPEIINKLQTGQVLNLSIKRLKIFVLFDKQYLGMLPDDIGKRLIKFIEAGNTYEAYTKSANSHNVIVFVKETKRVSRYKDQPSFVYGTDSAFTFDKQTKKPKVKSKGEDEDEDSDYSEEVEA